MVILQFFCAMHDKISNLAAWKSLVLSHTQSTHIPTGIPLEYRSLKYLLKSKSVRDFLKYGRKASNMIKNFVGKGYPKQDTSQFTVFVFHHV